MKPATPMFSLHFFPTSSVDRTRAHVPTVALPNPQTNRRAEYIQTLVENAVNTPVTDITRLDKTSIFFRPKDESANVASAKPPTRQPRKNADAGRPVTRDPAHCKDHSDMTDVLAGKSHDQTS